MYEHFIDADDVVLLGVNDGESLEKAESFLLEDHPPWLILLDPQRSVRESCGIEGIPTFILLDKEGKWQYKIVGYHDWLSRELIWLIDELRQVP